MNPKRILLADDHIIIVEALKKLIEPAFQVVATVSDGHALISSAEKLRPDVIIADINMPNLNGLEACERLMKKLPESKIIFLTVDEDPDTAAEAIRRGAFGYVLKSAAASELFKAIQSVARGQIYISPGITREPLNIFVSRAKNAEHPEPLTPRQREVLQLLAEGKSMKEAGDMLNITPRTIAFHKYSMMAHLGITRNSELVRYAAQAGICREEARP
jgi:DNA-binding NarL/FixJ family response regulator